MSLDDPSKKKCSGYGSLPELRRKVLADKAEYRHYLARAPIPEKLRILEEMRAFTAATQSAREENKARMAPIWTNTTFTLCDKSADPRPLGNRRVLIPLPGVGMAGTTLPYHPRE